MPAEPQNSSSAGENSLLWEKWGREEREMQEKEEDMEELVERGALVYTYALVLFPCIIHTAA